MKSLNRRDFLKTLGAGLAALALPKGAVKDAPLSEAVEAKPELADELVKHYSHPEWLITPDASEASVMMTGGTTRCFDGGALVAIAHYDGETTELRKGSGRRWNVTMNQDAIPVDNGWMTSYVAGMSSYTLTLATETGEDERTYNEMSVGMDKDGVDHWYFEDRIA